jgi:hypothetical protein
MQLTERKQYAGTASTCACLSVVQRWAVRARFQERPAGRQVRIRWKVPCSFQQSTTRQRSCIGLLQGYHSQASSVRAVNTYTLVLQPTRTAVLSLIRNLVG